MDGLRDHAAELAARCGGVVLHADLVAAGWPEAMIRTFVRSLHRLTRGAYALAVPETAEAVHLLRARGVFLTHTTPHCLSHVTAALCWQLPLMAPIPQRVSLTTLAPQTHGRGRQGVRVHGQPLLPGDVEQLDGLLVTSVTRTVLDCARRLPVVAGTALVDAALNRSMTTRDALVDMVAVMRRWTGVGLARAAIGRADPATESPGETWCRLVLLDAGVPVRSQVEVCDAAGFVARADFGITGTWVLVEFDGKGKYELSGDPAHAHWQEKLRHDALVSLGYEVVRVTWQELRDRVGLERKVRQAMHRSRQRHPGGQPPGWAIRST